MMQIKKLRLKNNLKQTDIARLLGIKHASVCNWEKGKTSPKAKYLPKLANIFKCKIDDLFLQ